MAAWPCAGSARGSSPGWKQRAPVRTGEDRAGTRRQHGLWLFWAPACFPTLAHLFPGDAPGRQGPRPGDVPPLFQNASWHAASSAPGAAVAAQSLLTVASVRGRGTPVGAVSPRPPERAPCPGATSQWDDLSHPGLAHLAGMAVPVATLPDTQGRNSRWASKGFLMEPLPRLGSEVGPAPRAPQRGGPVLPPTPGPSFMPRGLLHILGSGGLRTQAPPLHLPDALNGTVPMETGNLPSASASSGA